MTREQAIQQILDGHGQDAVYVFATGYIARTGFKLCWGKYTAFYMQGSMGLAPAIGLGLLCGVGRHIVVVNGDGAELMMPTLGRCATLCTQLYNDDEMTVYVLDNNQYESTGGQATARYVFDDFVRAVDIEPSPPDPRIPVSPKEITDAFVDGLSR